jgi:hypothetical protein
MDQGRSVMEAIKDILYPVEDNIDLSSAKACWPKVLDRQCVKVDLTPHVSAAFVATNTATC